MPSHKIAAFSPNSKYFAYFSPDDELLIWETLNNAFVDCKFNSNIYTTCSSLYWIPLRHKPSSPKKAKLTSTDSSENQLLAVGTIKGDILLYNVSCKNLYLHLVRRHSDAVNDMCFHIETDSFFTCSSDKTIAVWNISTGKQKSKWKAGDDPVSSICVIDENNMLSSSTSITWWNISEKKAIKKFSGHSAEIFKLFPVNAVSLNSCYFLSAAVNDVKINAWSLNSNECETPVASFVLSKQPIDLDISKAFSKNKPLVLSAFTEDGIVHIFEHILNGNKNRPIHPRVSIKVMPESHRPSIMSLKLSLDSETCLVAFGSSKDNMTFKHIQIRFAESQSENKTSVNMSHDKSPVVIETKKTGKITSINGLKSSSKCPETSQKKTQLDSVVSSYRRRLKSSSISFSPIDPEATNLSETEDLESIYKNRNHITIINKKDPNNCVNLLLEGLQTYNEDAINAVFHISDTELVRKCVENLSSNSLKLVLDALNNRLCHYPSCSPTLSKWLKEISKVHLNNIIQSDETREVLHRITERISTLKTHETISKMSALKGLLSLTAQISSCKESNSKS